MACAGDIDHLNVTIRGCYEPGGLCVDDRAFAIVSGDEQRRAVNCPADFLPMLERIPVACSLQEIVIELLLRLCPGA